MKIKYYSITELIVIRDKGTKEIKSNFYGIVNSFQSKIKVRQDIFSQERIKSRDLSVLVQFNH